MRGEKLLVLFLGSTIGNFEPDAALEFLRALRSEMCPGDGLLLGTDLVKAVDRLLAAYDDPVRVTAPFNLNLLARINRELDAISISANSTTKRATSPKRSASKCTCARARSRPCPSGRRRWP